MESNWSRLALDSQTLNRRPHSTAVHSTSRTPYRVGHPSDGFQMLKDEACLIDGIIAGQLHEWSAFTFATDKRDAYGNR